MEEMIDFDEWVRNYKPEPIKYVAVFDPVTSAVKSIGPSHAFLNEKNKIEIDFETAEKIINADIKIHNCYVDTDSNTLLVSTVKLLKSIEDILHRITLIEFSKESTHDVYLTYAQNDKTLKIELADYLGGTKILNSKNKKLIFEGEIDLKFFITEYNDPNLIFETFSVKISELIGQFKIIENINYDDFSVYTNRLFKSYVIEYK